MSIGMGGQFMFFNMFKKSHLFQYCESWHCEVALNIPREWKGHYKHVVYVCLYQYFFSSFSRLFDLLGTVFTFVQSDVKSKLEILSHYRQGSSKDHYGTVQSMIQYEVSNNITRGKKKPPSACRTFLRLHRALLFIVRFLDGVCEAEAGQRLGGIAGTAYTDTLAHHHTWLIRKAVGLAVHTLPTRDVLLQRMGYCSADTATTTLKEMTRHMHQVYDTVQEQYSQNDILDLPWVTHMANRLYHEVVFIQVVIICEEVWGIVQLECFCTSSFICWYAICVFA